jgi:cytochrome c oxidase subunit II
MNFVRSKSSQLLTTSIATLATLFSTACGGVQSALDPAGPQANNISKLWWLMFFVCSAVFIAVTIVLVLAISRSRTTSDAEDLTPELQMPPEAERRRRNIVAAAAAFTVVTLFVFLVASFFVGRGMSAELSAKQGVAVEVTGHQWWWEVRYLNDDASSIFTTANEIHIPVGTPVMLTLKASDVIHSFWVPNLHGKTDAIPGKIATMWLQADRPGTYRGQCAEYCGLQHAHMGLVLIAEPRDQFNSWLNNQTQPAIQPSSATAARGEQIFMSGTCVMCHAISGTQAGSNIGPNLTHVASRQTIGAATMTNLGDHLSQWIADSQKIKPGNRMPPHNLSPEDLQAVIDYMQTLK